MDPLYKPQGVEQRWQQTWEEEGLYGADPDAPRRDVRRHAPAAEHLRLADDRPLPAALARGHARALAPDARLQHALPARLRPRRHLDLGVDRADARAGGEEPARPRARGLRRLRPGVARALRRHDHEPVPAARRLTRLPAHALHDGRGLLPRGHALVRPPLRARLHLPREPDRQLVPARPDGALGPRGRARGRWTTRSRTSATRSPTAPGDVTIATVRPATILADVAVAVHPDDERYRGLVGKEVVVPFVERRVPSIADERVEREFGTGALKITPGPRPDRLRDRPRPRPRGADRDRTRRADERRTPGSSPG